MAKKNEKEVFGAVKPHLNSGILTEPTQEEKDKIQADKELLDKFLLDPDNKKDALRVAHQIKKEFTNWFTIPQIVKKFKTSQPEAAQKIEILMLFKICVGKVEKNKAFFKIDIDQRAQRILILEEIQDHEVKITILKEKLSKLN